jgi:hypothetical protein
MGTFDFRCGSDERLVDGIKLCSSKRSASIFLASPTRRLMM